MTRRGRDSDDEEIVITGHTRAAPADGERPGKRCRTTATGNAHDEPLTLLDLVKRASPRLLRALLAPMLPADLVALCTAFDTVKNILRAASANDIWKRSRANMPGPRAPRCPASISESEWTSLLFVKKCQHCGKVTTRDIDWGLRMRFCSACHVEHVKSNRVVVALPGVTLDILKLVPYSRTAGGGSTVEYYWVPEVLSVHGQLKRLKQKIDAGDAAAKRTREAFVKKRKEYVEEVLDFVAEGERWQKLFKDACAGGPQSDLRKRVVSKFVEMGYRAEDVEAELPPTISEAVLSGAGVAWTRLLNKVQPRLDQLRGALSMKIALLHEHYRSFLGGYIPRGWEALVPFGDISRLPGVQARLEGASDEQVAALAKDLTAIVDAWRKDVEQQLLRLLPNRPDDATWLRLALSVFVRGADPAPLTYPQMLLGTHLKALEFGPLPYATPQGPWTAVGLRYDVLGAKIAKEYCRFAGIEITRATSAQLDDSPIRLQCAACEDEWPLVLSWRQAIEHAHRFHDNSDVATLWRPASVATERQMQRLDEDTELWQCALCPAASQVLRSLKDVKRHLEKRHKIDDYTRGKEFRRSFAAPAQPPMTVLNVHTKSEERGGVEKRYECRHCGHRSALPAMLMHLKERHLIELKPQGAQATQSQPTVPPQRPPASAPRSADDAPRRPRAPPSARSPPRPSSSRAPAPTRKRASSSMDSGTSESESDSGDNTLRRRDGKPASALSSHAAREVITVDDSDSDSESGGRHYDGEGSRKRRRERRDSEGHAPARNASATLAARRPVPAAIRPAPATTRPTSATKRSNPATSRFIVSAPRSLPAPVPPRPTQSPAPHRPHTVSTTVTNAPPAGRPLRDRDAHGDGPPSAKRRAISINSSSESSSSSSEDETAAVLAGFEQVQRRGTTASRPRTQTKREPETIDLTFSDVPVPVPEASAAAAGDRDQAAAIVGPLSGAANVSTTQGVQVDPAIPLAPDAKPVTPQCQWQTDPAVDASPHEQAEAGIGGPARLSNEAPDTSSEILAPSPVCIEPTAAENPGETRDAKLESGAGSCHNLAPGQATGASDSELSHAHRGASQPHDRERAAPSSAAPSATPQPVLALAADLNLNPNPVSVSAASTGPSSSADPSRSDSAAPTETGGATSAPTHDETADNDQASASASGMRYACLRCLPARQQFSAEGMQFSAKEMLAHLRSKHGIDDAEREVHYTFAPRVQRLGHSSR